MTEEVPGRAEMQCRATSKDGGFTVVGRKKVRRKNEAVKLKETDKMNGTGGRRRVHRKQTVILERPPGSVS